MKFEHTKVFNFDGALRGMRNPMNSWDKSDSFYGCPDGSKHSQDITACDECLYDVECNNIVYLKVDRRSRLIKLLERGDDIEEAYRRSLSDVGQFDSFENEADFVLENKNYEYSIKEEMIDLVQQINKRVGNNENN